MVHAAGSSISEYKVVDGLAPQKAELHARYNSIFTPLITYSHPYEFANCIIQVLWVIFVTTGVGCLSHLQSPPRMTASMILTLSQV